MLESVINVNGDMTIENSRGDVLVSINLNNVTTVGGDLKIIGILITVGAFEKLKSVDRDLFMSHTNIAPRNQVLSSLISVKRHMTFSKTIVQSSGIFQNLRHIGGDLAIKENHFFRVLGWNATTVTMLPQGKIGGGGGCQFQWI